MADVASQAAQRLRSISPCFLVEDVVRTAEYYRDVLGFHFDRYWGELPCFVILLRDSVEISFSKPGPSTSPRPSRNAHAQTPWDVYVWVTDLNGLQEELQSKGARIIRSPEETSYRTREIAIEDCNGYVLCFGQDTSS